MLRDLGSFIIERVGSLISKKVGASAVGVSLIAGGQADAGWACIVYAALQAVVDCFKHYVAIKNGT